MDEAAWLAAINETPGDPGPRRAYADWLEERGDPRSEYLRAEDRLRDAPPGAESRQRLGRAWRELRAAQDPDWLARVEPGAPVPPWVPVEARRPPRLGLDDWFGWASESHYEWVILAVMAPIDAVARALIATRRGTDPDSALVEGTWERGVAVRRPQQYQEGAPGVPLIQLRGHAWTAAMYDTFNLSLPRYEAADADARSLSDRLGTLAVRYAAEDTSSATGYELYECGELIEVAEDACGEGSFASNRRDLPYATFPANFPDDPFRALGLYLPGFMAGPGCVCVGVPEPVEVERVDLLQLPWIAGNRTLEEIAEVGRRHAGFAVIHRIGGPDFEGPDPSPGSEDDDLPF